MEQGAFSLVAIMMLVFIFIPAFYLRTLNTSRKEVNEALYLASRSIEDCVEENDLTSLEQLSLGYQYSESSIMRVRIDEAKLLTEFEDVLYRCLNNPKKFNKVQRNIVCKMIVYPDRYVVIDDTTYAYSEKNGGTYVEEYNYTDEVQSYLKGEKNLNILPPKYFTYSADGVTIPLRNSSGVVDGYYFINTMDDHIKPVDTKTKSWIDDDKLITDMYSDTKFDMDSGNILVGAVEPVTTFDKNQAIINMINNDVAHYSEGVKINIYNPANTYQKNKSNSKNDFNIFEGITFLVIYKEESSFILKDQNFLFNQYNIAGYTLKDK